MRIGVDREVCEGHGQCSVVDMDLFPLDEDGLLRRGARGRRPGGRGGHRSAGSPGVPGARAAGVRVNPLFEPVALGPLHAAQPAGHGADGHLPGRRRATSPTTTVAYYRRRAEGGVGTITVEGCLVSPDTAGPEPQICRPRVPARPARLVDAMHAVRRHRRACSSCTRAARSSQGRSVGAVGGTAELDGADPARADASPRSTGSSPTTRHAARYAPEAGLRLRRGARRARLPAVELPLAARTTSATTSYGGTLENRARFVLEVARAILDGLRPAAGLADQRRRRASPAASTLDESAVVVARLAGAGRGRGDHRSPPAPGSRCT